MKDAWFVPLEPLGLILDSLVLDCRVPVDARGPTAPRYTNARNSQQNPYAENSPQPRKLSILQV